MIITRETLENFGACDKIACQFEQDHPNGLDLSPLWGEREEAQMFWAIIFASEWKRQIGWAIQEGLLPARIRANNLRGANLDEANLHGADLRGADLRWANLDEANLRWANLRWANLRGADLYGADLRGADLDEADLRGANLDEANLDGTFGIEKSKK